MKFLVSGLFLALSLSASADSMCSLKIAGGSKLKAPELKSILETKGYQLDSSGSLELNVEDVFVKQASTFCYSSVLGLGEVGPADIAYAQTTLSLNGVKIIHSSSEKNYKIPWRCKGNLRAIKKGRLLSVRGIPACSEVRERFNL